MIKINNYKDVISNDIKIIQNSFSNKITIEKKLFPFYFDKPNLLLNKSDLLSSKTSRKKDDITIRNNNPFEEKIYDGKKLSKEIHKKLEYFNQTNRKNLSKYKEYKGNNDQFSKYYFFSRNIGKIKRKNKLIYNENSKSEKAMLELINEYKKKKKFNIDIKSFHKDIFKLIKNLYFT